MNSIIIPTYCPVPDVEEKLRRALTSIEACTEQPYELIVVEQGKQVAKKLIQGFRGVADMVVLAEAANPMGYAKAVNLGVRYARGEYLLIVNNDIEVRAGWDSKLTDDCHTHRMGMLSASDVPHLRGGGIEIPCSWWSCVCIARGVWDVVGCLDEDKLNYRLHDQDWSIRAWKAGYRVGRHNDVQVKHDEASTYRHMQSGVDEGGERAEMRRRYGVEHFFEYARMNP